MEPREEGYPSSLILVIEVMKKHAVLCILYGTLVGDMIWTPQGRNGSLIHSTAGGIIETYMDIPGDVLWSLFDLGACGRWTHLIQIGICDTHLHTGDTWIGLDVGAISPLGRMGKCHCV